MTLRRDTDISTHEPWPGPNHACGLPSICTISPSRALRSRRRRERRPRRARSSNPSARSSRVAVSMSEETFRRVVEAEGKAVLAAGEDEQLELDFAASDRTVMTADGRARSRLYGTCDGVMTPVTTQAEKDKRRATTLKRRRERPANGGRRKRARLPAVKRGADQRYKQVYLTAFYDQDQQRRLVGVTRKGHKGLGKLPGREASRVRLRGAEERIGLIHGAPGLRNRMERLPLTALGLDFYHLSTHVHQGRIATFGEQSPAGRTWADDLLHTVRHEGYARHSGRSCATGEPGSAAASRGPAPPSPRQPPPRSSRRGRASRKPSNGRGQRRGRGDRWTTGLQPSSRGRRRFTRPYSP